MAAQSALAVQEDHFDQRDHADKYVGPVAIVQVAPTLPRVAVAVASDVDRRRLGEFLRGLNVDVSTHESLRALRRSLLREEVDLVITDVSLPDGNWVDVLRLTVQTSPHPGILVHSRVVSDRLWSEVLWRGAYDMLIAPYSSKDVCRVIEGALRAGCLLDKPQLVGLKH